MWQCMQWVGCWGVAVALGGCASQPASEFWRVDLAGHPIGVEERVATPTGWRSVREYALRLQDADHIIHAESEWSVSDGRVLSWRSAERTYVSEVAEAWVWGAPIPVGEQLVFDPAIGGPVQGVVSLEGGRRWFTAGSTRWWSGLDGESMGVDALSMHRVDHAPTVDEAIDPAQVLSLRVAGSAPAERGWTRAELLVTGAVRDVVSADVHGVVLVERPLWLELPQGPVLQPVGQRGEDEVETWVSRHSGQTLREAVGALAAHIPAEMAYTAMPASSGSGVLHGVHGNCTDHARVFVSTLKRFGQEAQVRVGWRYRDGSWVPHAWARVRFPSVGWVDVDPTAGERVTSPLYLPLSDSAQRLPWQAMGGAVGSTVEVVAVR